MIPYLVWFQLVDVNQSYTLCDRMGRTFSFVKSGIALLEMKHFESNQAQVSTNKHNVANFCNWFDSNIFLATQVMPYVTKEQKRKSNFDEKYSILSKRIKNQCWKWLFHLQCNDSDEYLKQSTLEGPRCQGFPCWSPRYAWDCWESAEIRRDLSAAKCFSCNIPRCRILDSFRGILL